MARLSRRRGGRGGTGRALGPMAIASPTRPPTSATYLETDDRRQLEIFQQSAARRRKAAIDRRDWPNAFYFHAPRSAATASSSPSPGAGRRLGSKVKASLDKALALEPDHAWKPYRAPAYNTDLSPRSAVARCGPHLRRENQCDPSISRRRGSSSRIPRSRGSNTPTLSCRCWKAKLHRHETLRGGRRDEAARCHGTSRPAGGDRRTGGLKRAAQLKNRTGARPICG